MHTTQTTLDSSLVVKCATRALSRLVTDPAIAGDAAISFTSLLAVELCNRDAEAAALLLDVVDASASVLPAQGQESQLDHAAVLLGAANAAAGREAGEWPFVFIGYLIGGMQQIGRHDVICALRAMAGLKPTHRLEIRRAASGQWAGRVFDSAGKEVAGIGGCSSADEVEQSAYHAGYLSLDVVEVNEDQVTTAPQAAKSDKA